MSEPVRLSEILDEELAKKAIEHLDFDPQCQVLVMYAVMIFGLPVPIAQVACAEKAAWVAVCRRCSAAAFECETHHEAAKSATWVACSKCKTQGAVDTVFATSRLWS